MNTDEFRIIAKTLKANYTEPWFLPDDDSVKIWMLALTDLDYKVASAAVAKCISTREEPPKIATIRRMAAEIIAPPEENLGELEAWALVSRAIRNSYYGAEKEFDELPAPVQKAVGSPANLREWGQAQDESLTVIQSQFQRAYRTVIARRKETAAMPVLETLKTIMGADIKQIGN